MSSGIYAAGAGFCPVDQPGIRPDPGLAVARQGVGGCRSGVAGGESFLPRLGKPPTRGDEPARETGCSVVAVERDDELVVEFPEDFRLRAERRDFYLRQRGSGAKICRAVPANIITNGSLSCAWEITSKSTKISRQWLYLLTFVSLRLRKLQEPGSRLEIRMNHAPGGVSDSQANRSPDDLL